jgi:hypothetical protein
MNSQLYVNMCLLLAVQSSTILTTGLAAAQLELLYERQLDSPVPQRRTRDSAVLSAERLGAALAAGAIER